MSCGHCLTAASRLWGGFDGNCRGCVARGNSRTPNYRESQQQGRLTHKYRLQLEAAGLTHEEVRAAAAADFEQRRTAAATC